MCPAPDTLDSALSATAAMVDAELRKRLAQISAPSPLGQAMAHALLAGGKRLRPFLLIECAGLFGKSSVDVLPAAIALECLHTYSLVHDDLPAMDDDDMRRGKPTVHKAFDEATAILAGDGLLTLAFQILGEAETHPNPETRADLVVELAKAAGASGMVGGQMLDLSYESQSPSQTDIATMQGMKTGALFHFACWAGGRMAGASAADQTNLASFARAFGRAFQITDDLLDAEGDAVQMGKSAGKDAARGKATLVGTSGAGEARAQARNLIDEAKAALAPYGNKATNLTALAEHLLHRAG